jgi:hypothetical protein
LDEGHDEEYDDMRGTGRSHDIFEAEFVIPSGLSLSKRFMMSLKKEGQLRVNTCRVAIYKSGRLGLTLSDIQLKT